jgi:peptidoglycan/xylan/chitin deacetylase (PgdA/CDA1 family)
LEVLSQQARVLSLGEMLTGLDRGTLPARSIAITFDDGYADNLHAARPLLERHGFPATVFVTAGLVGSRQLFWWDELAQLTLAPAELPSMVRLDIEGRPFSFGLGPDARLDARQESFRRWRFHEPAPTRRHLLYQTLWRRLQPLSETTRRRALGDLREHGRFTTQEAPGRRIMHADEIVELVEDGLIEVGAHTMTHPVLSRIPVADQVNEISQSKAALEQVLGQPISSFAYPHGGRGDYTQATIQTVRGANLRSACTTSEGWLRPGSDRYQLPRIHVPPVTGADVERLLSTWL